MELPDSVMCDLHLDIHMGLNDNFNFGPRAMGSLSSNSVSSSCTSPDYGPFTPTSGRSTSPRSNSMEFGSSFDSYNSLPFDFTPPSSAVSTSFSMGSSFTSDGSDLLIPDMPATPTRSRVNIGFQNLSLGGCSNQTQISSSSAIPMYSFTETPHALGSTFNPTPVYGNNWDMSSTWSESPGSFELFHVPSKGQCQDRSLDGVKKASAALQKEQQKNTRRKRAPRGTARKGSTIPGVEFDFDRDIIEKIPSKRFFCDVPGCTKSYMRKEHCSRHIESHTGRKTYCDWCQHSANRNDNFGKHLEKHLKADSKSPRVKVITDPAERAKIEKMMEEMKVRRKRDQAKFLSLRKRIGLPKCKESAWKDEANLFEFKDEVNIYETEFKFKDDDE